jgi:hypothetical protein
MWDARPRIALRSMRATEVTLEIRLHDREELPAFEPDHARNQILPGRPDNLNPSLAI